MTAYVALGSSFAAGPGIRPVAHRGALRSARNYPHLVARALALPLADVTASGATTDHLLTDPQRTIAGTLPAQIGAVTADTRLVTITAGGNDAGYLGTLTGRALANAALRRCPGLPKRRLRERIPPIPTTDRCAAVAGALARVVAAVGERAPEARIVLVDYLPILAAHDVGLPLDADETRRFRAAATALAAAFAEAARTTGADLVRASVAGEGHEAGTSDPWVTGLTVGVPFAGGPIPFHPNADGMAAVARLVVDHVSRRSAAPAR
ncbi:Lipase 2 precursor [Actinomadura rubteroloni]|uniref:Lipase 2 n=1 Tax=Actinomadura rubteroloni TaxID=1926885 RepID=A0A2P4UIQ5_9ACTN|nr:SGNH/GDSL hydrolase family protein [Actinomadura rubteroloni]POM24933.1 Lipase 2 precursor [Actinomadura rubteroloni]